MIQKTIVAAAATLLLSASSLAQTIVYVDADATGNNDGTSWSNAYTDLNDALVNNTTDFAEIWIAEGFYTRVSKYQTFNVDNNELLYGGFSGAETDKDQRDAQSNPTIISGDTGWNDQGVVGSSNAYMSLDNTAHVFTVSSNFRALFDGLIIEHAFSTTGAGGAIRVTNEQLGNLEISNCNIRENVSYNRAGLLFYSSQPSSLYMFNNVIEDNVNVDAYSAYTIEHRITGVSATYAEAHLVNNLFKNNMSESSQWGGTCGRFTVLSQGSQMEVFLTNNTFVDNAQAASLPALFAYELGVLDTDIFAFVNNNMVYNNTGATHIFGSTAATAGFDLEEEDSFENVLDFTDTEGMMYTHVVTSSPFVDYANGDYRPISAYHTIGDLTYYDDQYLYDPFFGQAYPTTDLAGNPRFNAQGQLAVGAYQPAADASVSEGQEVIEFSVYPNPANGSFTIQASDFVDGEVSIINVSGEEVLKTSIKGGMKKVNLNGLSDGTYFVQVITEQTVFNTMVLVQ